MPGLVVLAPPMKGIQFSLSPSRDTLIGRESFCNVVLPQRSISRKHARIFFEGGNYKVEDLGSSHGTFLNGRRVEAPTALKDGDRINVYDVPIAFFASEESSLAETTLVSLGAATVDTQTPLPFNINSSVGPATNLNSRLRNLLEISRRLGSSLALDEIFPRVLDVLFHMFPQAVLGEIQLADAAGRLSAVAMKHGRDDDSSIVTRVPVGNELAKQTLIQGQPILKSSSASANDSVFDEGNSALICVPILGPSRAKLGTILLETEDENRIFTEDDLELVAAVGIFTGQAVEHARAHQALLRLDQTQRQLEMAREIQLRMLPRARPSVPGYSFYEYYAPAEAVGGDYYSWDVLPDSRVIVNVADACGKALPGALMIAQFATEARHCIASARSLKMALSSLNRYVCDLKEGFITLCLCLLDVNHHTLTVVNAGHMPPLCHRRNSGTVESLSSERRSFPLGIDADEQFHPFTVPLAPGDQVLLFTDGITEAMAPDDSLYGAARLKQITATPRDDLKSRVDAIVADVEHFRAGRRPSDDTCLVGIARSES